MATLNCPCGHKTKDNYFPSVVSGWLRGDDDKDRLVMECEKCGRLLIGERGEDAPVWNKWYVPEDGTPGKLFSTALVRDYFKR